jgi:hypothetical protein
MQIEFKISIIFSIFSFLVGILYQDHRIKKSNIREKAKEINQGILETLKILINRCEEYTERDNYIQLEKNRAFSVLDDESFVDVLIHSSVFKLENKDIRVIYKKDKIFNRHAVKIANYLKEYLTEVNSLKYIIENLHVEDIPLNFEQNVRNLIIDEFGSDCLDTGDRREELVFALFSVSVCNSKDSYKNGRVCVIGIIERRFQDLQNIVKNDPNTYELFLRVIQIQTNVNSILSGMLKEIENLQEDWQNKLII